MAPSENVFELGQARADTAAAEATLLNQDAIIARLRDRLQALLREGRLEEASALGRQFEEAEQARRDQLRRLAELRALAEELFGELVAVPDPAEQLGELETGLPIALLPVRLETHFQQGREGVDLQVRVYPDDLHVEVHEPEFTDEEAEAGESFWLATIAADDGPADEREAARLAAWRQLAVRFEPERAAWIARTMEPEILEGGEPAFPDPPRHQEEWTRAPQARTLPDRWVILGYSSGTRIIRAWGRPIPDPLPVGPSPDTEIPEPADGMPAIDPGVRWMFEFDEAEALGMGVRIPLGRGTPPRIDLLVALGVKASVTADESAERVAELLDGHHYAAGLGFVRQGTPTNNTGDSRSGFNQPDATFERSFGVERGEPLALAGDESNGDVTAVALGLDPGLFAHVANAGLAEQNEARCMNAALWHTTWGYFLGQVMARTFTRSEILGFRSHFVEHVRGRGPLPTLRVGNQPYGLLPVTSLDDLALGERPEGSRRALDFAQRLRDVFWRPAIDGVPHVGAGGDPDATLLGILGMESSSRDIAARTAFGGHYFRNWWHFLSIDGFEDYNADRVALARTSLDRLAVDWDPRVTRFLYLPSVMELDGPRVQEGPLSLTDALDPNYITWLRTASPTQINAENMDGGPPNTLLYLVLRHATLMAYGTAAFELIDRFDAEAAEFHLEPELLDFGEDEEPTPTFGNVLDRTLPDVTRSATLAEFLHGNHDLSLPDVDDYTEFWEALECLEGVATDSLDLLLHESLDLCSHRLDAWITSFAALALDHLRSTRPHGLHLGGFGWVEDLQSGGSRRSEGHVHAPSLEHATTAAVLRSGYLTHNGSDGGTALAVDLSSARTRLAMSILDAVRQGQPLGAVFGYRFERGLHENHPGRELDQYILPFRELAPLVAQKLQETDEPVESIAAHNVVDGLALHRRFKDDDIPWGQRGLPPLSSADGMAVRAELRALDLVVDAVSDAVTAESVFQAIRGNPTRSGAVLDAIARGEAPPPELEVARTERSGIALTHRLLIALPGQATTPADWPVDARQVRAPAAPRLNEWVADLLGSPDRVRCRVEYLDAAGKVLESGDIALSALRLSPLDALHVVNLEETEGSELERRLALHASDPLPVGVPADAAVRLLFVRDPSWGPDVVDVPAFGEVIRSVRETVAQARVLAPADLAVPGEATDYVFDAVELQDRADAAVAAYRAVADGLEDLTDEAATPGAANLREQLIRAAHFGVQGAYPLSLRGADEAALSTLAAQAAAIAREMRRHIGLIDESEAAFDRTTAAPAEQREHDAARLQHVFGPGFAVLPRFPAANPGELAQAFAASDTVQDGDPHAVFRWLKAMTRVRPITALFADAYLNADAIAGTDPLRLRVGQLPFQEADRWVGLDNGQQPPEANRLSLVAQLPEGLDLSGTVAGLVVDEWVETVPSTTETTAVTFHFDQPNSRAPNAVLLAVPPDPSRAWDLATLEKILLETVELTKLRAVDTEALVDLGHLLPALYFANNVQGKTVATDFSRNRAGG